MAGRRVLVTGLSTFWGGRVAQALEQDPTVDVIVGLDTEDPTVELERTEYVRADQSYSILNRLVKATRVDTVLHTFLVVDSTRSSGRALHETNVIGTMNLLAAAGAAGSSVRNLVVKSSTLVYGAGHRDPYWFREDMSRTSRVGTRVERSLLEVEDYLSDFADDNPHVTVSLLRFANVLGPDIRTPLSRLLDLPLVPALAGFDPLLQFVEEHDVVRAILHVMDRGIPGIWFCMTHSIDRTTSSSCTNCTSGSKPRIDGAIGSCRAAVIGVEMSVPRTFAKRSSVTHTCGLSSAKSRR